MSLLDFSLQDCSLCWNFLVRSLPLLIHKYLYWVKSVVKLCLSSSENSGVEIVYGLKLLRHFAAIRSHSHPRAHSQLQYAQSAAVKTLKHMLFHNL